MAIVKLDDVPVVPTEDGRWQALCIGAAPGTGDEGYGGWIVPR